MTLDLIDCVEQFPELFSDLRPPLPDEVETCLDWLAGETVESWTDITAGTLKHQMDDTHVRTASMMAALIIAEDWDVKSNGCQLVVC